MSRKQLVIWVKDTERADWLYILGVLANINIIGMNSSNKCTHWARLIWQVCELFSKKDWVVILEMVGTKWEGNSVDCLNVLKEKTPELALSSLWRKAMWGQRLSTSQEGALTWSQISQHLDLGLVSLMKCYFNQWSLSSLKYLKKHSFCHYPFSLIFLLFIFIISGAYFLSKYLALPEMYTYTYTYTYICIYITYV